jgi:hypothetical protein
MRRFAVLAQGVENGTVYKYDGLEHEGKLWLVPQWLDVPAQGVTKPARLVRFDHLRHQHSPNAKDGIEYVINVPIPIALFDVRRQLKATNDIECKELPDISFPLPNKKLS